MARKRHRFAERRKAMGLSQERLAEAVRVDASTVARWERGETDPLAVYRPRLAEALNVSVEEVGELLAEGSETEHPATERTTEDLLEPEEPLPITSHLLRQEPADAGSTPASRQYIDHRRAVAHAERLLGHFLALEAEVGGDQLYAPLAAQVERFAPVADAAARPSLLGAFAQLCQLTGWLALDANRHSIARQHFCTAVLAAHQADEPALAASALAYMSLQETYRNHPERALALARTAYDVASGSGTPFVNTMLATRLARAQARAGNGQDSLAAIGRAEEAFARSDGSQPEPLWLSYVDEREVAAQRGACYLDLGQYQQAVAALTEALQLLDQRTPTQARDRVHYLSRLAKCHLLAGDLDQACATAHEALDHGWTLGSARVVERIGEFHAALAPYARYREIRAFRDRFSAFMQSR
jgi:transcriptional regulator with XRE-family HTH domain